MSESAGIDTIHRVDKFSDACKLVLALPVVGLAW